MKTNEHISTLLAWLGYTDSRQFITLKNLHTVPGYRHSLGQAFREMSIYGAFGLFSERDIPHKRNSQFTPFVYIAEAANPREAQGIHRSVWSQGIVPFLIIIGPDQIWACNGMAFSSVDWPSFAKEIYCPTPTPQETPEDSYGRADLSPIAHLKSYNLRSSIAWRDGSLDLINRVDSKLLNNLKSLSSALIGGYNGNPKLKANIANALIGRFLYIYFLVDRKIISQDWIYARKHHGINLDDPGKIWKPQNFWALVDDLDDVFNGSVFKLSRVERKKIKEGHIHLVRQVIKHNYKIFQNGVLGSFLDFDFSALRTETLSAVYELFFENQGKRQKIDDGAFYTPPYLVDYVLDRVEEEKSFHKNSKVLDCAAGSGVFLVGAYRRIIEHLLQKKRADFMPLSELQSILKNCIFGVEKNSDAAHIAAFSLYLTLLDYLSPKDRNIDPKNPRKAKMFPSLVGDNILNCDFFSLAQRPNKFSNKFDFIVGNPPWQKISKMGRNAAKKYDSYAEFVDQGRADQLFFITAFKEYLKESGTFGILMSAKSLISPSAKSFPTCLMNNIGVSGIANLSHLRRKLFEGADHPAVAIFGGKTKPSYSDTIWIYYPMLSSLPSARDKAPWCIIQDKAEIEYHKRKQLLGADALFKNMMLRPVDRNIAEILEDACFSKKAITLGDFCKKLGLEFKRGGSPNQTNLPNTQILTVDVKKESYYGRQLDLIGDLLPLEDKNVRYSLSLREQLKVSRNHRAQFSGEIIAIPRSMARIDWIEAPFAFNSGLNSINFKKEPGHKLSAQQRNTLKGLATYLQSSFVQYACALFGRMWFLDGRRLEVEDFKKVPLPLTSGDEVDLTAWINMNDDEITSLAVKHFELPNDYIKAASEYCDFRIKFQNGKMPQEALDNEKSTDNFRTVLQNQLSSFVDAPWKTEVEVFPQDDRNLAVVRASFIKQDTKIPNSSDGDILKIINEYDDAGASVIFDSLHLQYDRKSRNIYLVKPLLRTHWTIERAFSDSRKVFSTIFSGSHQGAE